MKGPFTKLIIWQKAIELVKIVYALSKEFLADERYALTDQIESFDCLTDEIGRMLGSMLKKYGSIHCSPSPSSFA